MRGTPESWARLGPLPDVMGTIARELGATVHRARLTGVNTARMVVDPGIGFGKRKEQNSEILARLGQLAALDLPIMAGPSRKAFLAQADENSTVDGGLDQQRRQFGQVHRIAGQEQGVRGRRQDHAAAAQPVT